MSPNLRLYLAPMEGVVDVTVREYFSGLGAVDVTVTEFIRVTSQTLPDSVFLRECPELMTNAHTASGTPVVVQLLGGDPEVLTANAVQAVRLGAQHIDLNFGCPAKLVNRHDGGAVLLQFPERIHKIVATLRKGLPDTIPVSAKMRLGFRDTGLCLANAQAIATGGASHLTVHCRTKEQMYKPPVDWTWLPRIREAARIPIVANGDIWTVADFRRCQDISGCSEFMLGRGALRDPWLFHKIKGLCEEDQPFDPSEFVQFFDLNQTRVSPAFAVARSKQWLRQMSDRPGFDKLFSDLKVIHNPSQFRETLKNA